MWYWIFRLVFICIFKLAFRFRVEGLNNLPQKTNFIIVANHASWLDPLCVMAAVPQKIYCIASRYLYKSRWLKWFLKKTEAFPTGSSSQKGAYLLSQHKNVGLFPEGGCSHDGKLKKFKRGAALLAAKTGILIVPCTILGSYEVLPRGAAFPKLFRPIKVKIGKPVCLFKQFDEMIDDLHLEEGTFMIRSAIEDMMYAG